jgi:hypothetical protein
VLKTERSTRQRVLKYCVSLFILSALYLFLVGCSPTKPAGIPLIDQSLMQSCPPLPRVATRPDGQIEMGELLLADIELAGLYKECARGKDGLIEAIRYRNSP